MTRKEYVIENLTRYCLTCANRCSVKDLLNTVNIDKIIIKNGEYDTVINYSIRINGNINIAVNPGHFCTRYTEDNNNIRIPESLFVF